MCLCIYAQQPESMRNVASDGVFYDDWDNIFDPIDLGKTDSLYFFTNFSDFSYHWNYMSDFVSDDSEEKFRKELPFGIAFDNPFSKRIRHALFIRFKNNLIPDGYDSESEKYTTSYVDLDGDQFLDIKTIAHEYNTDFREDSNRLDLIWNNNIQFNIWNVGFKYSSFWNKMNLDDALMDYGEYDFDPLGYIHGINVGNNSFEYEKDYYYYEENDLYYSIYEKGDFETVYEDKHDEFVISAERDNDYLISNSKLRFDLGFENFTDLNQNQKGEYCSEYYYYLSEGHVMTGNLNETCDNNIEVNQTRLFGGIQLEKELEKNITDTGFYEYSLNFGLISGDKESYYERNYFIEKVCSDTNTVNNSTVTEEIDECEMAQGDHTGFDVKTHFRVNLPLNEYALFGIGCFYKYSYINHQLEFDNDYEQIESELYGEEFDDELDFVSTFTKQYSGDLETIDQGSELRLPMVLEFKIDKDHLSSNDGFSLRNFVYRIGTTFIFYTDKVEDTYTVEDYEPWMRFTEYGDGSLYVCHDDVYSINSNKQIDEKRESLKQFSAGLGYVHSKNVKIDLAANYNTDTENYTLGLSFTIRK